MPRAHHRHAICAAALMAFLLAPALARAGGMFLPGRGTRALGRAGSFVAGADDLEAVYYNPAGLADAFKPGGHVSALLDMGLVFQRVDYTRVDSGGVTRPEVRSDGQLMPLPFAGVGYHPDALGGRLSFAFAVFTPWTGLPRYPDDGPQRYSLVSLAGTAMAVAELAFAVRITPELYFGAGFQNLFLSLDNRTVLAGCTQLNCAPEDPRFDALTQVKAASWFTPSGNLGLTYAHRYVRAAASLQLPYWVRASGTVRTRLPSDPQFDGAVVVGDGIDVRFNLPLVLRVGVEGRPAPWARVELGFDWERWSTQRSFEFAPRGVYIDHVLGVGRYDLRPMSLDRAMRDTFAVHLGGELSFFHRMFTVRAGYLYETSAVPDATLSVLTPDGDKHLLSLGGALQLGPVRLDLAYGHFFQPERVIATSRSLQLNPISPSIAVAVGNGRYAVSTDVLSLGAELRY